MNYIILARKWYGDKSKPLTEVRGAEGMAVELAQRIYKLAGMNRALVVDENFKVIFKVERRCKCLNVQYNLDGEMECVDCKRIIPANGLTMEDFV